MFISPRIAILIIVMLPHGCSGPGSSQVLPLKHKATGPSPETIALYEAWFGHPKHISVGYSSHDPAVIKRQIGRAKTMRISAFVVDWYGDREPFIDKSYSLMQTIASSNNFKVAMMYDEADEEEGATDQAIADLTMFHDTYLLSTSAGHQAYLTYEGRPVIFVFPKGGYTNWDLVRARVNQWSSPPLLINENLPDKYADAFDGFYAWISPGDKGWAPDGSNWGREYLGNSYQTMSSKYPDKIIVGGAWAGFNDVRASWGLNRHISARCGQTYGDTLNFWRTYFRPENPPPFIMIETWSDHEEGTAVEDGISTCSVGGDSTTSSATQPAGPNQGTNSERAV